MVLLYGVMLFIWLTIMAVAEEKSWAGLDISKGMNLIRILLRLAVIVVACLLMSHFGMIKETFNVNNLWMAPFGAVFYYGLYIIFGRKYREKLGEFFIADRWNGMVFLSCIIVSCSASMM